MFPRPLAAAGASLLLLGTLSACASDSTDTAAESSAPAACPVQMTDPWVKAADSGMSAAFGVLSNTSDQEVTIVSAESPASARMELHEVVDKDGSMVMQPVEGGFPVPAGGSLTLQPGGYHLMLMELTDPIEPGEDLAFTLTCSDGGSMSFTAQAKEFEGGNEEYVGGGMGEMDMSASPSAS